MTRDEAREIYKEIVALYPLFHRDATEESVKLWLDRLELGDYEATKKRLFDYSLESTYPPALAHILVRKRKPERNHLAEQIAEAQAAVKAEREDPERAKRLDKLNRELAKRLKGVAPDE